MLINGSANTASPTHRDTVYIMGDAFDPGHLSDLKSWLREDGYVCAMFAGEVGLRDAAADPRALLLLLGSRGELSRLCFTLRSLNAGGHDVPVMVYLKGGASFDIKALPPEIDEFLVDPLSMQDVRLRVRRTIAPSNSEQERVRQSMIMQLGMKHLIGNSPTFLSAIGIIPRAAACDVTMLIVGATGTGKEMCARAIHYLSPRAGKPLIPINCGSVPAELFENELFGHEPGAFTDARRPKRGLISEAEGGTLFLDEIDTLPLSAQVKLLRFTQDKQYKPLGASTYRHANVRVIAATNCDLKKKIADGLFREDLYYRLNVVSLSLPSLDERREDIRPLAEQFLKASAAEYNRPARRFSDGAMRKLMSYSWPGNVRELENIVCYAVIMGEGTIIRSHDIKLLAVDVPTTAHDIPPAVIDSMDSRSLAGRPVFNESFKATKARVINSFERTYLKGVLEECGGNISKASRVAKKDRRSFFALLKKHGLTQA